LPYSPSNLGFEYSKTLPYGITTPFSSIYDSLKSGPDSPNTLTAWYPSGGL
jgi:hypothetical protein